MNKTDARISCAQDAEVYCESFPDRCCHCEHNELVFIYGGWLSDQLNRVPTRSDLELYWDSYKIMKQELPHYV